MKAIVSVRAREVEPPRMSYYGGHGGGIRTFKREVTACACDVIYLDVEIARVRINYRQLHVYKRLDQTGWTTDYESVVRYAQVRGRGGTS